MVRSHWIGPVFGVLALTGLAMGQTATPLVPVLAGDAGEQIVTVQELGKPAQKCKILKKWIEPDGTRGYQVQALDTGEVFTIEDAPATAPAAAHGGPLRAVAMRIFHSGRHGESLPPGMPMPPPDAVVVGQPFISQPPPPPPPSVAAAPMPCTHASPDANAQPSVGGCGSCTCAPAVVTKIIPTPYVPGATVSGPAPFGPVTTGQARKGETCPTCQCGPAVGTKMEPVPSGSIVSGPAQTWPFTAGPAMVDAGKPCQCAPPVVTKVEPVPSGATVSHPDRARPFAGAPAATADAGKPCPCGQPGETRVQAAPYPPVPSIGDWFHSRPTAAAPVKKVEGTSTPTTSGVATGPTITLPPPPAKSFTPGSVSNPPPSATATATSPTTSHPAPTAAHADIAQGPTTKTPTFKLLDPSTWKGSPAPGATAPNTVADAGAKGPPAAGVKTLTGIAKVEATPAQPGDWRQSWGQIDHPGPPPAKADVPAMPSAAAEPPARPNLPPVPTITGLASGPKTPPPATPVAPPAHPDVLPAPTAVASTTRPNQSPAPALTPAVRPDAPAHPPTAAVPPVHPSDTASAAVPPGHPVMLPPVPGPSLADLPHAQVKADDPLTDPEKYAKIPHPEDAADPTKPKTTLLAKLTGKASSGDAATKSGVRLGMKSALAAVTDGDVPKSGPEAAFGFDPNEPNAFSEVRTVHSSPNAFTEPPPPPPPMNPQGVDMASNAFAVPDQPREPGVSPSGVAAPRAYDSALPTRMLPPPTAYPAPAAPLSVNYGAARPTGAVVPAGYRPGNAYDLTPMVAVLRESLYPSQREDAAEQLGALDWRRQPEVLDILVERAREDPAPTVRAECVRSLNRLKANTLPVVEAVKALQSDDDPRVRHEADEAYANLTGATAKAAPADESSGR